MRNAAEMTNDHRHHKIRFLLDSASAFAEEMGDTRLQEFIDLARAAAQDSGNGRSDIPATSE